MAINLEQRKMFTKTTAPLAQAKKICDTHADARCVRGS